MKDKEFLINMHSGRILKVVWEISDGKKRGSTEREIKAVTPLYKKYWKQREDSISRLPTNIYREICRELSKIRQARKKQKKPS